MTLYMRGLLTNTIKKVRQEPDQFLLMLLLFVLPFERIPSVNVAGITLRMSLFVGVAIIIRTLYLLYKKKIRFHLFTPYKILAIFLLWLVLIIPESINLKRAVMVVAYDTYAISLCVSITLLYKKKFLQPMIKALLGGAVVVSLFGLYQYFGDILGLPMHYTGLREQYTYGLFGFPRVQSTALEPLYFASYLLLPTMVVIGMLLTRTKLGKLQDRWLLAALTLFSLIIFLTVSRGAFYGYLFALIITYAFCLIRRYATMKRVGWVSLAILIGFIGSWLMIQYLNKNPTELFTKKRGTEVYSEQITKTTINDSGDDRAIARKNAITILKNEHIAIVIGIGPGQYGPYMMNNTTDINGGWTIINNLPLELWVELGMIGLLLFVWFVAYIFIAGVKTLSQTDTLVRAVMIGLLGYLLAEAVQYQAFSTLYVTHIWIAIALMLSILLENGITLSYKVKKNSK